MKKILAVDVWHGKDLTEVIKAEIKKQTVQVIELEDYTRYLFSHEWFPQIYSFYHDGLRQIWIYPCDYETG